jgi:hypothetical protein
MFWRKGRVIYRPRPKKLTPTPTQPNKFNTNPKGPRLTASCQPQDAPQHVKQLAEKLFNASVATSTTIKYETATRHVAKLEPELAGELPFLLSPADSNLILTSLALKGLSTGTIRSYLAGTRRLAMARGT